MARITAAELKASPPRLTKAERSRLDAMNDSQVDAAARADDINPEWSDAELEAASFARLVRETRARTGLSQPAFAKAYRINVARLRDWEQARFASVDSMAQAYMRVIAMKPDVVKDWLADASGAESTKTWRGTRASRRPTPKA
jgi:putative transcriptional regulator